MRTTIGVVFAFAVAVWTAVFASAAQPRDAAEHFKYGSVGIEPEEGLPYWIWQVLPRMFADKLPGGYASLGFVWEPDRELPIGFSKKTVAGSDRIAVNCAFCHTATYRTAPDAARVIVPGGAATRTRPQAFSRFLEAAAADPRFNAGDMLEAIGRMTRLSWTEALSYRFFLIPGTRKALRRHREEFAWMDSRPDWGRGRIDPLNPFKFRQLRQAVDNTIGNSDMTPLWALGLRDGRALHWDGLNASLQEVLVSSAIGNGASKTSVDLASLQRVGEWLRSAAPPPFPFPIDRALAAEGERVFDAECSRCHAPTGQRMGQVIPIDEIGTDRQRLDTWTESAAAAFNATPSGAPWPFMGFRKTGGYVAMPLVGAWLNAPYLHNGSVPTLSDLLKPPAERPAGFYRGYDVIDPIGVGFVADESAAREGELYETHRPGNSAGGHGYGTGLSAAAKTALLEFLKTL
jgi:mono/diheme cytochrome c family protein